MPDGQNGWSKNERYVNTTLDDLKADVMRIEHRIEELALDFAYSKGRARTMTGLISAGVSGVITVLGMYLERIIFAR